MSRYIDADEIIIYPKIIGGGIVFIVDLVQLNKIPTADVKPVKHGKWKPSKSGKQYVCSECNHIFGNKSYKYCPFCGAEMYKGEKR